ncbi:MAG TPA: DNA alkylation repair protein [Verrucomicrobiae bacterium]|nr:DNA alkylation repair protein [Verrucomicrobiae bacterium]
MDKNDVLRWLEQRGSRRIAEGMGRYGIQTELKVFGVAMGTLLSLRKQLGRDHALAVALWKSGCYEARLLATLVDDPQRVTRQQMNSWAASFENWADCDTACFHLFDRTPFAWDQARQWAKAPREFVKRAGFVLMACLALHDKDAPDSKFLPLLTLIERGANDERNFVKKGVNWALRSIGRRGLHLNEAARLVARRLAKSKAEAPRWIGRDALRELASPKVRASLRKKKNNEKP